MEFYVEINGVKKNNRIPLNYILNFPINVLWDILVSDPIVFM